MSADWLRQTTEDGQVRRLFEQERLILEATEQICQHMAKLDIQRAELADELGTSRANVTQLLSGSRNMTLRTLSDLAYALGQRATLQFEPLRDGAFIGVPMKLAGSSRPRSIARVTTPDPASESVDEQTKLAS